MTKIYQCENAFGVTGPAIVRHDEDTNETIVELNNGAKYRAIVSRAPDAVCMLDAWRAAGGNWEQIR